MVLLGMASSLTSIDFGMTVNVLNVTPPTGTLMFQGLVLENLAPGGSCRVLQGCGGGDRHAAALCRTSYCWLRAWMTADKQQQGVPHQCSTIPAGCLLVLAVFMLQHTVHVRMFVHCITS